MGIVQLRYAGHRPSPPTKHLPVLLILAERAAQTIRQAWTNLREQERGLSHQRESKLEASRGEGPSKALRERAPREAVSSAAEREHPFLEIRCFGAFELYRQGKLVTPEMFGRRGALTLLKILLIQRGRPVSRDALAEYLWPEADPGVVANRLYVVVHALRRVVEPAPQGQPWRYICNDGDRYYFNTNSPHRLDIEEFREYVGLGERLERGGDMTRAIEAYEAAADLYRGDVLEDEAYAEWCWGEREHLGEICLDVLRKLAVRCAEQGALDRSIERYREALRLDPLREETYQGLMRVLWEMGRRDDALHQYQVCRDLLRRELDVPPLPETEQLYSLIRGNSEQ